MRAVAFPSATCDPLEIASVYREFSSHREYPGRKADDKRVADAVSFQNTLSIFVDIRRRARREPFHFNVS
jgi:hypothetical protein